jgi:hypothetical protein
VPNTTVVYITSNRENSTFEEHIKTELLSAIGNLPLISVSQKPIDFGHNLCIGDVGVSDQNAWRQAQLGAIAAETKFVCFAESDCLYPADYFSFEPPIDCALCAIPLYVLFAQRGKSKVYALKPKGSELAAIYPRQLFIDAIDLMLKGFDTWGCNEVRNKAFPYIFNLIPRQFFTVRQPIVSIKTDQNMHRKTVFKRDSCTRDLPFRGPADQLLRRLNEAA